MNENPIAREPSILFAHSVDMPNQKIDIYIFECQGIGPGHDGKGINYLIEPGTAIKIKYDRRNFLVNTESWNDHPTHILSIDNNPELCAWTYSEIERVLRYYYPSELFSAFARVITMLMDTYTAAAKNLA